MGKHPHHALSAPKVKAIKRNGHTQRFADGNGLYLVVNATGSKSWVLRTIVQGKRCDIGLGSVDLVTLAEAREEAHRLRKVARAGGDPLAERRSARREVPTFEAAAKGVHGARSDTFRNDKHRKQWLASLGGVIDAFGQKRVDAITSADILHALGPVWLKRPETSRRVLQRVRTIFDWCKAHRYCSGDNPTDGVIKALPKQPTKRGHHAALPYSDVPTFIHALRVSDAGELVQLAFEFMILTATRTSETLNAKWAEIDVEKKSWTIPAARMKAGVEHRVPLSGRSVEVLQRAKVVAGTGTFVFPGRNGKKPLSNMVFLMVLRRMKRNELTAHGFRSSFRDWAAEQTNFPRAVCEAALAHTLRDKTEAAYNRTDLFERRRELMDAWAQFATATPKNVEASA